MTLMRERRTARYQQIVETALRSVNNRQDKPLRISEMCRAADVSVRTLARAFHAVHHVPPSQHLRTLRLTRAREMLLAMDATSVTQIALQFGFRELGRFATLYRQTFGETPSATLRRRALPRAAQGQAGDEQRGSGPAKPIAPSSRRRASCAVARGTSRGSPD